MPPSPAPRKPVRKKSKVPQAAFLQIVYGFASGISIKAIAGATGISAKTVRAEYLLLRKLLKRPAFNRWHGTKLALLTVPDPQTEALIKATFIDVLAECYFNTTCHRNFRLGNRKALRCRACPISDKVSTQQYADELVQIIHLMAAFYARIGIRGENGMDSRLLFRERFIHTISIETARNHSKRLTNGLPDPFDTSDLAVGSMIERLLTTELEDGG